MKTAFERYRVMAARQSLLDWIVERVEREGWCEVTDAFGKLDDEPEPPLMSGIRVFEEAEARRDGRRPHLEAPRTFAGELRALCDRNGWVIEWNPQRYTYYVARKEGIDARSLAR